MTARCPFRLCVCRQFEPDLYYFAICLGKAFMSVYTLQKLLRDVNRKPACRKSYFESPATFVADYDLTEEEREALLTLNIRDLFRRGVHGLILRPFTLLHSMPEPEYLKAI